MKYKRKCNICGEEFETDAYSRLRCYKDHYHPWPICGKPVLSNISSQQHTTCSRECRNKYQELQRQKSLVEKYGTTNAFSIIDEVRKCKWCGKEFKPTHANQLYCGDDYYECPVCGKKVKIKDFSDVGNACSYKCRQVLIEKTNLKKYGVKNAAQAQILKET